MSPLHITAGDSTVELLKAAKIEGSYLPWRDLLHEGPVPANLSLDELSTQRANYIHSKGWGKLNTIQDAFHQRDQRLLSANHYDSIILWFEHDLYDQLQLIQILSIVANQIESTPPLFLINTDRHLGYHQPEELIPYFNNRVQVNETQLNIATTAWDAFRASTPENWANLLKVETNALPFLRHAIRRMLQELPNAIHGLSKTQYLILTAMDNENVTQPADIFEHYTHLEEAEFLGDWSFFNLLATLTNLAQPLLREKQGQYFLTDFGRNILKGNKNWLNSFVENKWYGGYQQISRPCFFWDEKQQQLIKK